MIIKTEKEYKEYEARAEALMQRGTELGDMDLLPEEEKAEFMQLSEALDEYGSAYHPLPGQMSTLLTDAINIVSQQTGGEIVDCHRAIGRDGPTDFYRVNIAHILLSGCRIIHLTHMSTTNCVQASGNLTRSKGFYLTAIITNTRCETNSCHAACNRE